MVHDGLWPRRAPMLAEFGKHLSLLFYYVAKRCFDFTCALLVLFFFSPVLLLLALWIMVDSSGPAIYVQKRAGARWRTYGLRVYWEPTTFRCYKFRTMGYKCDQSLHENFIKAFAQGDVEASADTSLPFKLKEDPRVTRAGRVLRKTSLDELPQLFNIFKGEMSFVGPRPVPLYEADLYKGWQRERLNALPGLTGMWQVKGRSQVTFDEMVKMDIDYIRDSSFLLDLWLLLATVPAVIRSKGAG